MSRARVTRSQATRRLLLAVAGMAAATLPVLDAQSAVGGGERTLAAQIVAQAGKAAHPALLLPGPDWAKLNRRCDAEPRLGEWRKRMDAQARGALSAPVLVPTRVGHANSLLAAARGAGRRISVCAAMARLSANPAYGRRAVQEMLAIAQLNDWNPAHFLDTAELTVALSFGYDWLYDSLTPGERAQIRTAIIAKGLQPGLIAYARSGGWTRSADNWNLVCNGAMIVGALAVAREAPEAATPVLAPALASIQHGLAAFAPDGGWSEGLTYWSYGSLYLSFALSALSTSAGPAYAARLHGPGLAKTGWFRIHALGPTGVAANFADAWEWHGGSAQMFWLAHTFKEPAFAQFEAAITYGRPSVLHLLWSAPEPAPAPAPGDWPLAAHFREADVAFMRSRWNDHDAWFVSLKGGHNGRPHGHLDLGSFVLDALGQRWALDLGPESYDVPGYFGRQRWGYPRVATAGHNTWLYDGQSQAVKGQAPITGFHAGRDRAYAICDMSAAFGPAGPAATRGVQLDHASGVIIQDEWHGARPGALEWAFMTQATPSELGRTAILLRGGRRMAVTALAPADARFEEAGVTLAGASPPPLHRLTLRWDQRSAEERVVVWFHDPDVAAPAPAILPLAGWDKDDRP